MELSWLATFRVNMASHSNRFSPFKVVKSSRPVFLLWAVISLIAGSVCPICLSVLGLHMYDSKSTLAVAVSSLVQKKADIYQRS